MSGAAVATHVQAHKRLSDRERQVVALVAEGLLNKQIAHRVGICEGTTKTHVSTALEKLKLATRGQLALWYVAQADDAERERLFATVRRP